MMSVKSVECLVLSVEYYEYEQCRVYSILSANRIECLVLSIEFNECKEGRVSSIECRV